MNIIVDVLSSIDQVGPPARPWVISIQNIMLQMLENKLEAVRLVYNNPAKLPCGTVIAAKSVCVLIQVERNAILD